MGLPVVHQATLECGSQTVRDGFFEHVVRDASSLACLFRDGPGGEWDFLPFQQHPILEVNGALYVIDNRFLVERVIQGNYWNVLDHERSRSDAERQRWTQAYGEMLEAYVLDLLRTMKVPLLDGTKSTYSEEDLASAYPGKVCDWVVDLGTDFCCFEIVSGRVTVGTRIRGEIPAFESDTEKIILKKARQLDELIRHLLDDEEALTGAKPVRERRVIPVIINPGTYPVNPLTMRTIKALLEEESLLQDPRIEPLCIIDVLEVELLEVLQRHAGYIVNDILRSWKRSPLADVRLLSHLDNEPGLPNIQTKSLYPVRETDVLNVTIERLGLEE